MYMKLAEHTTDYFIGKKLINESERDIYVYSFEVLVSDLVYFILDSRKRDDNIIGNPIK